MNLSARAHTGITNDAQLDVLRAIARARARRAPFETDAFGLGDRGPFELGFCRVRRTTSN